MNSPALENLLKVISSIKFFLSKINIFKKKQIGPLTSTTGRGQRRKVAKGSGRGVPEQNTFHSLTTWIGL